MPGTPRSRLTANVSATLAVCLGMFLGSATLASATGPGGWDHLGTGATLSSAALNGRVDSLVAVPHFGSIPDSIYAGGVFTSAGGNASAAMIARWDGAAWHSIGAPVISTVVGASVHAIAVDGATGRVLSAGTSSTPAETRTPTSSRCGTA